MSRHTRFVPEKDLTLAEAILDRYNARLHCSACNKKWTSDGTTFRRDCGGRRGALFYRKFRCKGKDIGCNANHPVSEFMAIALKDLGPAIIADMRLELNLPEPSTQSLPITKPCHGKDKPFKSTPIVQVPQTPEQSKKRPAINSPTGLTPDSKRQTKMKTVTSMPTTTLSVAELQLQLFLAQEKLAIMETELKSKQKTIDYLISIRSMPRRQSLRLIDRPSTSRFPSSESDQISPSTSIHDPG